MIAVTRRQDSVGRLWSLGATHVVVDTSANWPMRVTELTESLGADVVVDIVGADSVEGYIAATCYGGTVHLVGYAAGEHASFDIFVAIRHGVTIQIATAGSRRSFEALVRLMEEQKIRPVVDRSFCVSEFRAAFDYLSRGGQFGKVVTTF